MFVLWYDLVQYFLYISNFLCIITLTTTNICGGGEIYLVNIFFFNFSELNFCNQNNIQI